jgi:hypothetical protein
MKRSEKKRNSNERRDNPYRDEEERIPRMNRPPHNGAVYHAGHTGRRGNPGKIRRSQRR